MEDVTPLSDAYILDIITAHLSTAGIHQTIMFLVALADMGETRRCRIKYFTKQGHFQSYQILHDVYLYVSIVSNLVAFSLTV